MNVRVTTRLPVKPGIVTGLAFEATIARTKAPFAPIACHGPGLSRAIAAARALLSTGVDALVSFGVAGALDPSLRPGTAVLPQRVIDGNGEAFSCDDGWRGVVLARTPTLDSQGDLLTATDPVTCARHKATVFETSGARVVDMESAGIAAVAREHGVPFIALRVVLDEARHTIPRAAMAGMRPDGETSAAATIAALLRRPHDIVDLLRLARANQAARQGLARLAHLAF